ncbi:hypothetical protein JXB41_00575 [Candidatus Woesearchaeota archaeon]|nr:hypothetical protein [Candidatus Woesearchaeota archaeon]
MNLIKNVIFTACDSKYGDFLTDHWLNSLKENVNLKNIDIVVLDYGLTKEQVSKLKKEKVIVEKCKRDGHVVILRFRDMANFLRKHKYYLVLSVDGGDVIFQADISDIFEKNKKSFQAVYEDVNLAFDDLFFKQFFKKEDCYKIKAMIKGKKMVNAGVIVSPANKFRKLCEEINFLITDKSKFGPDQIAVNYIFYRDGFNELEKKYNFLVSTSHGKFYIRKGIFYLNNGEKIPVVHNAGNVSFWRVVKNFGYGNRYNKLKISLHLFQGILYFFIDNIKKIKDKLF